LAKVTINGVKYRAKFALILGPLAGFGRGANLPYFGNQSEKWAYSPQEQKRRVLRGFPKRR